MRFDSAEFLFFFALALVLHRLLPKRRVLLIAASYIFYASWNPPFLLLLIASTFLDYAVGQQLERAESPVRRRTLLGFSIALNMGVLGYFKYVNFLLDNAVAAGLPPGWVEGLYVDAQIPLGISFYTFQTMSYTIDVYRRKIPASRSFRDFALFVAFFPQLIAGPIIRAKDFLPQIHRNREADGTDLIQGLELVLLGLFKKVVIADNFAILVDQCFDHPGSYSGGALLLGAFAFSAQIYADFSGYSTIARGLARMLGFRLPRNFDYPLLAPNPMEYRRAWHMTIGAWFRDYVYRPLGGDRGGMARTLFNTMLVWVLFGLWHGAAWPFLLWGFYNGLLVAGYRVLKQFKLLPPPGRASLVIGYLSMPVFIGLANVFFRAQTVDDAHTVLARILTFAPGELAIHPLWLPALLSVYGIHWASKLWYGEDLLLRLGTGARIAVVLATLALLILLAGSGEPFYYFQF